MLLSLFRESSNIFYGGLLICKFLYHRYVWLVLLDELGVPKGNLKPHINACIHLRSGSREIREIFFTLFL